MRLLLSLTALLLLATGTASAQEARLPKEVEEAWSKAGAFVGWMGPRKADNFMTYTRNLDELDPARAVPAFQPRWKDGMLAALPFPTKPFGLSIRASSVTDQSLKELAGLKELVALDLGNQKVTDLGLKDLAALTKLKTLALDNTLITSKGLSELTALKELTWLSVDVPSVMGEGLKELAALKRITIVHGGETNEDNLKRLREGGLTHMLPHALAADGKRPSSPAEITSLKLPSFYAAENALKELADLKQLNMLDVAYLTDAGLASLREVGLLHALVHAKAAGGKRPTRADEVVSFDLTDRGYLVTPRGIRELAGLPKLNTLTLPKERLTDEVLATLRGIGLLHALAQGQAKEGRPTKGGEVTMLDLEKTPVTAAGLKELAPLTGLTLLSIEQERVTDEALKSLRAAGLLHALPQAKTKEGRPARATDVTTFVLERTGVTAAGVKELSGLTQLTLLPMERERCNDDMVRSLREAGLLHALPGAQAADPARRPTKAEEIAKLDLTETHVTGAVVNELSGLKGLVTLSLAQHVPSDAALFKLRDMGMLHTLVQAQGPGGNRPTGPGEIVTLNLSKSSVKGEGVKALAECRQLTTLEINNEHVTDAMLKGLSESDLLHALSLATGAGKERPRKAKDVVGINLLHAPITEAGLKELAPLKNLNTLLFNSDRLNDATIKTLREIGLLHAYMLSSGPGDKRPASPAEVVHFALGDGPITDQAMKELVDFTNLESLHINNPRVTKEAVKDIARFKQLTKLHLHIQDVDAASLKHLAGLKLTLLDVYHHHINDDVLKTLRSMGLLHALMIAQGAGMKRPTKAAEVVNIGFHSTKVSAAGVKELIEFENLDRLSLCGVRISDETLKTVAQFKRLDFFEFDGAGVSDRAVAELRKALPKCNIQRY